MILIGITLFFDKWTAMFNTFALLINQSPKSPEVQTAIKEWFDFLNENFGEYSFDAFYGLGQLYIEDTRFTKNIDQYGEGLAKVLPNCILHNDFNWYHPFF